MRLPVATEASRAGRFRLHASLEIEEKILAIGDRDGLELAFALSLGHAKLLVRFTGAGLEPRRRQRLETLAAALRVVLEVCRPQLRIHARRELAGGRSRTGARLDVK